MTRINVAIDGHSSCGKSTMAKKLARQTGYIYIDTGAMYRGVTLYSMRLPNVWEGDTLHADRLLPHLSEIEMHFEHVGEELHLFLNGEDVEAEIRGMAVSGKVSPISCIPEVRTLLVEQQQRMACAKGVVMDGRDIGTVVLPDAELKVFVTARPEVRARRRLLELESKGTHVTYEEVYENVTSRDRIDSSRATSPLRQADDALLLDNSDMTLEEQQQHLKKWFDEAVQRHG